MITEVAFFDRVLVEAISHGSLRWILPIGTTRGEKRTAYNTLRFWLSKEHRPEAAPPPPAGEDEDFDSDNDGNKNTSSPAGSPVLSILPIITSPHLDRIAFVRACWASDSMMNRRRLWGQVKQFESLWVDYRKHGWQVDRFYSLDQLVEEA
ncbi:uncharacterized protein PHACADRAFT_262054 [Phanerochaete carnosa HHB-10118-sp]|uniref:Uncharacterized protein n=1 Tax=Phanerochaete carnosa (strain HHB-10118-sp) TaxID=650164 RepID=K5UPM2_PHACS|nr:uncharacterized protein PHACADRAFT_262054 [Phanerochaete carnosa HHB-10118-sp]EKM51741.1 hypothetical protein PHACADRAFT_262054 [Phanerochaete carnosa HHB-10118-sp]